MKIKKDTTTGNVLILGTADAIVRILTPGAYAIRAAGDDIHVSGQAGAFKFDRTTVSHTVVDGSATAFSGTTDALMILLNSTFFNFAPAAE